MNRRVVLLLCLVHCSMSTIYPSIYIPIGVGYHQKYDSLGKFGEFPEPFSRCGKSSFTNVNSRIPSSFEGSVGCEPHPERIIVTKTATNFGALPRDLKQECEVLTCGDAYPAAGTGAGTIPNALQSMVDTASYPNPEPAERNVCQDKISIYTTSATSVLFANEGQCYKVHTGLKQVLEAAGAEIKQVPRWLNGNGTVNKRLFFYDEQASNAVYFQPVPYHFKELASMGPLKFQDCGTACDIGQVVKITLKDSIYDMMIYLTGTCPSFRICLDPENYDSDMEVPKCKPSYDITVLVDNGLVLWPDNHRASILEMKSPSHEPVHVVPLQFGWTQNSEFYFSNDHRETVTSDSTSTSAANGNQGYDSRSAQRLAFFFPTPDCLFRSAGIVSEFIEMGKTLSDAKITKGGDGNATLNPNYQNNNTVVQPTTIPPVVQKPIPRTTTPAPVVIVPGAVALEADEIASNTRSLAAYVVGKWWAWGVYFGFIIGTLLTLSLGGGILYIVRRSVYGIWYRGMYKRYGCDVADSTAGVTGIGFGNTVTGDQTVKAGATGATGTTGGTTGGASQMKTVQDKTGTLAM